MPVWIAAGATGRQRPGAGRERPVLPGPVPVPRRPLSPQVPVTEHGCAPARPAGSAPRATAQGPPAGRPVAGLVGLVAAAAGLVVQSCRAPSAPPRSSRSSPGRSASAGAPGRPAEIFPDSVQYPVPGYGARRGRPAPGRAPDRDRPPGQLPCGRPTRRSRGSWPATDAWPCSGQPTTTRPEPRGDRGRRRAAQPGRGPRLPARPAPPARERPAAGVRAVAVPPHTRRPVRQPAAPAVIGAARRPLSGVRHGGLRRRPAACARGRQPVRQRQKCSAWKAGSAAGSARHLGAAPPPPACPGGPAC